MKTFVPYREIGERDVLVVDGQHKHCIKLSHWTGANTIKEVASDSSAEIVLKAIKQHHPALDREEVSASHFDIDGFVGVWSVFYPDKAMQMENMLVQMAHTGDFREFNTEWPDAEKTLKMVCWMNRVERETFYPPFGVANELSSCHPKFHHFLNAFEEVFENIDKYSTFWKEEYDRVLFDIEKLKKNDTKIEYHKDTGLTIIETPQPVHYYALTGCTVGSDIVLSIYSGNRYELEYKYTTWIDMVSRPTFPRIRLTSLINELNSLEKSGYKWYMDRLADSGPILRLVDHPLPKVIRYDQPYKREIFSSSIEKDVFKSKIMTFFTEKYRGIIPQPAWTVKELRIINK